MNFAPALPRQLIPTAVGVILTGTILCACLARMTNYGVVPAPAAALASVELSFADLPDGGVAVRDAATGGLIADVAARNDGFLRMVIRLMSAERQRNNIGPAAPYILTQFSGGRMRLTDAATGQQIELEAFGPSNIAEFSSFLTPETHS